MVVYVCEELEYPSTGEPYWVVIKVLTDKKEAHKWTLEGTNRCYTEWELE